MRRTQVKVKSVPAPVEWILKNATGQQLNFMARIVRDIDFKAFVGLVGNFKHYNVYEVFNSKVQDSRELDLLRAAKRGEVAGLDALLLAAQLAQEEIEKRKKL